MNIYTQAISDSLRSAMEEFDQKMSAISGKQNSEDSEHK